MLNEDVWTSVGGKQVSVEMVCGATCLEKKDLLVHEVPEVADPDLYESSAEAQGTSCSCRANAHGATGARTYALALPVLVSHLRLGQE